MKRQKQDEVNTAVEHALRSHRQGWETGWIEGARWAAGKTPDQVELEVARKFGGKSNA